MPVAEADVGTGKVDEEVGPGFIDGDGVRRWCFLYAVIDEVAGFVSGLKSSEGGVETYALTAGTLLASLLRVKRSFCRST